MTKGLLLSAVLVLAAATFAQSTDSPPVVVETSHCGNGSDMPDSAVDAFFTGLQTLQAEKEAARMLLFEKFPLGDPEHARFVPAPSDSSSQGVVGTRFVLLSTRKSQ